MTAGARQVQWSYLPTKPVDAADTYFGKTYCANAMRLVNYDNGHFTEEENWRRSRMAWGALATFSNQFEPSRKSRKCQSVDIPRRR